MSATSPVQDNQLLEKDYLSKALQHLNSKEYESAISLLDNALAINPKNKISYERKGLALNKLNRKEEALAAYEKVIELDPNMVSVLDKKGDILDDLGRHEASVAAYQKIVEIEPRNARAHRMIGWGLSKLDQSEAAITAYQKALEIEPRNAWAHRQLGTNFDKLDQNEAAITAYQKALEIEPRNAWIHLQIGVNLNKLRQFEASIASCKKSLEIEPQNALAHREIGYNLYELGQFEASIVSCKKSLEIEPQNAWAHRQIGSNLYKLGQFEASIASYNKSLEIEPNNTSAFNTIGERLTELGRFQEAIDAYDQTIKLDPKNKYAYANKGFALYHLGEIEEAIKWYDKQIEITPHVWAPYLKKGKALQDLKKDNEALEYFQKGMDIIKQGRLDGSKFYALNGVLNKRENLNSLEIQLIMSIKELLSIPNLQVTPNGFQQQNTDIQDLNKRKDNLKIKFINAALTVQNESKKHGEIDQLKKELEEVKNLYKKLAVELGEVKADIQDSGMKELAEVKRGFKALEEQDPELLAYCKTFYWTAMNLFGAYRAMSTGLMQANFEAETNEKEKLLVTGVKKAASLLADVASGVPIVGGAMKLLDNVIDGIYGAVKENRFNNKVAAINKIIQAKLGTEDEISLNISKAALAITSAREQAILYPELSNSNSSATSTKIKAGLKWLSDKVNEIKDKILPSIELHDKESTGAALALQDVTLYMVYICKNHESIIKRKEPLDKQIVSIIKYNGLDQMLEERDEDKSETKSSEQTQRSHCCTMF